MLKRIYTSGSVVHSFGAKTVVDNKHRVIAARPRKINGYTLKNDYVYTLTRAISARVNQNYDGFPSNELKKAYQSFKGRPVFVNHNNEDHRRTRGMIVDSQYKESGNDKYIELLIEVDAKNFPKLASLISTGELDSVSMGTDVEFTRCSYCNNKAYEVEDFCDHVRNNKGQTLSKMGANGRREDVLVYESCHGLNFFEISYVFDPADETAINQRVYLPGRHGKVAAMQKRSLGEITSPDSVDTLREQHNCPNCEDDSFDPEDLAGCAACGYVQPPEEYQDPDTMKSRVLQIVRKDPANNGKEGMHMPSNKLAQAVARRKLADAQRRLADGADMTTDQAMESDSTDPTKIDQQWTSVDETRAPDDTTEVTDLPDSYKSSAVVARNRAAYLQRKNADFGQDDPSKAPGADPQASAPSDSDGPNSGPPSDDTPGQSNIDGLPIDWKQDESGQPYGTIQGTDLDIFVNEDMSWQVLPEGSNDPIAQGQGSSYEDCVEQAFQQGQSLGQQDPSATDPSADTSQDPSAAPTDPSQTPPAADPTKDPTKVSKRRKKAEGDTPEDAKPDERTDVTDLPDYETVTPDSQYDRGDYDNNSFEQHNNPVDGSDVQNFAPGGKAFTDNNKSAARKVSSAKILELLDAYTAAKLVANTKVARTQAIAEIEKLHPAIVNDRIALLSRIEAATQVVNRPRSVVPTRAASQRVPAMGRSASSSASSDLDTLMNL